MQRIIPLELVGQKSLNYDLYDENGQIIYKNGDKLTPALLMMLNHRKVYRRSDPISLSFDDEAPKTLPDNLEYRPVISDATVNFLTKNARKILKSVFNNEKPEISTCIGVRDIILDEVGSKLDKIECIGQLRIVDEYTFSHIVNVSSMSAALGIALDLDVKDVKDLVLGALLHDIGKMKVPKDILNKPGKLDPDEFQIIRSHSLLGYQYIKKELHLSDRISAVALEHQERYGGGGYPNGLKGKEIELFAQIVAIADVYDALVSNRVYKKAVPSHEAIRIMLAEGSESFNPYILYRFIYLANYKDTTNLVIKEEDKV